MMLVQELLAGTGHVPSHMGHWFTRLPQEISSPDSRKWQRAGTSHEPGTTSQEVIVLPATGDNHYRLLLSLSEQRPEPVELSALLCP